MNRLRVALINDSPPNSGLGRYAYELFNELSKLTDAEMVYLSIDERLSEYLRKQSINVVEARFPCFGRTLNNLLYFPQKIPRHYNITHFANQNLNILCNSQKTTIITFHDLNPLDFWKHNLTRYTQYPNFWRHNLIQYIELKFTIKKGKIPDRIIATSEYTKRRIVELLRLRPERIKVIPYGVSHRLFRPRNKIIARAKLGLPMNKQIILHVGSEDPRKNVESIIIVLAKLRKYYEDIVFVRVGKCLGKIRKMIQQFHLENFVRHIGSVSETDVALYYNAADVLIFPSYYEGFGLPPLEAMASGCPVIASNRTSLQEIVGDAGVLINPEDIDEMIQKLQQILSNVKLREELADKGLRRSNLFSWEKTAKKTLDIYEEAHTRN